MRTSPLYPLLLGFVLATASASRADDIPALRLQAATELKANAGGHFVTRATINGSDVTVLVDTGATAVALSYEDAETVGLRPGHLDFNVPVATANGMAKAARVTIDRIAVDAVAVDDVAGLVLPEGALRGTLLGMSFLGRLEGFKIEDGVLYLRD
jgi:aspartyl protease family protein